MVAEGVPGELARDPVILVQIVTGVGQDDVRHEVGLELLEELLDARLMREERVAELRQAHFGVRVAEKCFGRRPGLRPPFTGSAQHHPADSEVWASTRRA